MGRRERLLERTLLRREMTGREREIVVACCETLLPPGGAIPLSGVEAGTVEYFDRFLARSPVTIRVLLRVMLRFVELSPRLYGMHARRLSQLPEAERERALQRVMNSRIYLVRAGGVGLRTMLTIAYFGSDEVLEASGLAPDTDPFGLGPEEAA